MTDKEALYNVYSVLWSRGNPVRVKRVMVNASKSEAIQVAKSIKKTPLRKYHYDAYIIKASKDAGPLMFAPEGYNNFKFGE